MPHSPGNQLLNSNSFHPKICILIHCSILFRVPSNYEVTHYPDTLELGHSNNPKDTYQKTIEILTLTIEILPEK